MILDNIRLERVWLVWALGTSGIWVWRAWGSGGCHRSEAWSVWHVWGLGARKCLGFGTVWHVLELGVCDMFGIWDGTTCLWLERVWHVFGLRGKVEILLYCFYQVVLCKEFMYLTLCEHCTRELLSSLKKNLHLNQEIKLRVWRWSGNCDRFEITLTCMCAEFKKSASG